ncbi:MAG: GNAT family N-acetyltransferase [Prevotella sp.]|nr:GNAT family N-acetyltransferase [Prevotella sp.]
MEEIKITANNIDNQEVRQLYESAFPDEEKIPYKDLKMLLKTMPLDFTVWYDKGTFIGLTIVYKREAAVNWFWYFAVGERLRGKGYGSKILRLISERYARQSLIIDIESPRQQSENIEQRQRRYEFYLRNGFHDTGVGRTFRGITYTILASGNATFTTQDYDAILKELRKCWDAMPKDENK